AMTKNASVMPRKIASCMSVPCLPFEGSVQREDRAEDQEVLRRFQARHSGHDVAMIEKAALRPARVVHPILQPQDVVELAADGVAILDAAGECLYGLPGQGPAALAVPGDLRADRDGPALADLPLGRHLGRNPRRAWLAHR